MKDILIQRPGKKPYYASELHSDHSPFFHRWQIDLKPDEFLCKFILQNTPCCLTREEHDETSTKVLKHYGLVIWREGDTKVTIDKTTYELVLNTDSDKKQPDHSLEDLIEQECIKCALELITPKSAQRKIMEIINNYKK